MSFEPRLIWAILDSLRRSREAVRQFLKTSTLPGSEAETDGGTVLAARRDPHPTIALIDVASVYPSPQSEAEYRDGIDLIDELVRRVVAARRSTDDVAEVVCRLYGGWYARDGTPMQQRVWLLRNIRRFGGLRSGVRLIPELADSLAYAPSAVLWGTYKNKGQKMVDHMLALDGIYYARTGDHDSLLVISDDEDFLPAVLVISTDTSTKVCWMRQHEATNDKHLNSAMVELLTDPAWL